MSYVYQRDRVNQSSNMKGSKLAAFSASKANSRLSGNLNQKNQSQRNEYAYQPKKSQQVYQPKKIQTFTTSTSTYHVPFYKKHWFWAIIAVLILAGIGTGVFFLLSPHNNQVNATSDSQLNSSLKNVGQNSISNPPNATQTNNSQPLVNPVTNQTTSNTQNTSPTTQPTASASETKNQTSLQNKTNSQLPAQIAPVIQKTKQNTTTTPVTTVQTGPSTSPQPFTITDEQKIVSPVTTQPTNPKTVQPTNSTQVTPGTTMPTPQDYYLRHPQQRPSHNKQYSIGQVHTIYEGKSHKRLRKYE